MIYKIRIISIVISLLFADNLFGFASNSSESGLIYKKEGITSLNSLIDEALQNNPEIKALNESWEASKMRISQAGAWKDPQINFNIINLPAKQFSFGLEPMTGKQFLFMQQIPFPGKTSIKEKVATEDEKVFGELFYDKKNEIIRKVKTAYYNLYLIDKSIEITEKNKSLLDNFIKIVSSKYEVGKGLQQDILKSQVEISKIMEKLITLRQKRKSLVARINTLLNRLPETQIVKLTEIEQSQFNLKNGELEKIAFETRPMLKAMENQIEKNEYLYELAKKDYYPDLNVSLGYTQREDRRDFFTAMFSSSVPLFINKKQSKKVEETAHTVTAARESYIGMKNEIQYKIRELTSNIDEYNELLELLSQGIIPQASQSLQSAIAGYQVDKVDFLTLLNNQMTLFNYEIEYYRILSNYEKSLADLEFIIGKQLF